MPSLFFCKKCAIWADDKGCSAHKDSICSCICCLTFSGVGSMSVGLTPALTPALGLSSPALTPALGLSTPALTPALGLSSPVLGLVAVMIESSVLALGIGMPIGVPKGVSDKLNKSVGLVSASL